MPFLSASNRYRVRPSLPTRALAGTPEMAFSDTVEAAAGAEAAGLACVAGAALAEAAGRVGAWLVAGLVVVLLELVLEQAATPTPIAAQAKPAIQDLMPVIPLCEPGPVGGVRAAAEIQPRASGL
jgi:hypothetical protein